METTFLNIKLALICLFPLFFLIISLIRFRGFWGNTKVWAILFHLVFLVCIIFHFQWPEKSNLLHGMEMLLVSLVLTVVAYLNISELTAKKLKTIWKIPLVGSLVGLYLPFGLAQLSLALLTLATFGIVVQSKERLYLVIKPMMGLTIGVLGYQISTVIGGRPEVGLVFGLISYLSAERIWNMALIKDWMKAVEQP